MCLLRFLIPHTNSVIKYALFDLLYKYLLDFIQNSELPYGQQLNRNLIQLM